jgi:ferredoxin
VKLVADCASDPPLSATGRALAVRRADDLLYGLGLRALGTSRPLAVAVRHEDAARAIAEACARLEAAVEVVRLPDAWPPKIDGESVAAAELVTATARARSRPQSVYVTVAGAVAQPLVLAAPDDATVESLVAAAGGALDADWVALAGGAPGGRLVERATTLAELDVCERSTLVVLSQGHAAVRRAKTPIADWLLRAASACEGCRVCGEACPVAGLLPHELCTTLTSGRDDGVRLARAVDCIGCGVCDAVCPSALSPRALVGDVRARLLDGKVAAQSTGERSRAPGLEMGLLTLRLGLGPYDRPPAFRI